MANLSFILFGALCIIFASEVNAMDCNVGGISITCPTILDKKDEVFCCETSVNNVHRCCDIEDYMKTNTGMIVGIAVGALVILFIVIICCCCFCSCCCLAKRRVQRGRVLYGPVSGAQIDASPPTYQVIHPPPSTQAYNPPPYNPNYAAAQPPMNPHYK